jgi:diacylglycerol kinase (ATP)
LSETGVVFVVNPAAGNGATGRAWPEIAQRAAAHGLRGDALLTGGPGHACELAERAAADGARLVVIVGGDGTVNEAVNGLLAAGANDIDVALLPCGTGDDFARTFGIRPEVERALAVATGGKTRTVDVGRAKFHQWDGSDAERYFVNFAGAGISGAIAVRGAATSRRLGARLAYFWATVAVFFRWKIVEIEVRADDERRQQPMYEVLVANGVYTAGGMRVAPDAVPDDGLLDAVLIGAFTKPEFAATFPKIYRGTHVRHPKVEVLRARAVAVDAATPLPVVLDGEQAGTTPARFEIVPAALRLRVPG